MTERFDAGHADLLATPRDPSGVARRTHPEVVREFGVLLREGRARLGLAVAAAWFIALVAATIPTLMPWPDGLFAADFSQFWTSALIIREGAGPGLFDMNMQTAFMEREEQRWATTEGGRAQGLRSPYFYPPPLALLFVPLTFLPIGWAYIAWWALSLMAFVAAIGLPLRGHPLGGFLTVGMLSYLGVIMSLREGQVHGLLALFLSLSLLAMAGGRPGLGGVLLGVLLLKPQFALLFPLVFVVKRRWRELAGMVATGVAVVILSLVLLQPTGMITYIQLLRGIGGFYPSVSTSGWAMVNWRALLAGLIPDAADATGSVLMLLAGTATALLMLLAWRGRWEPRSPRFPLQVLATVLATAIATPHSHFSGTALALAPLAMLIGRPDAGILRPWIWCLLALSYLLPVVIYLIWPAPKWLLAPFYLLAVLLLAVHTRPSTTQPGGLPA